jgi:hypothetical protein
MKLDQLDAARQNVLRASVSYASEMNPKHGVQCGLSYLMGASCMARYMLEHSLAETLEDDCEYLIDAIKQAVKARVKEQPHEAV